jgi:hypothetical protein
MDTPRPPVTAELTATLAEHARLPLPQERVPDATGLLQLVQSLIDQLDAVELGETPPATSFDARWS